MYKPVNAEVIIVGGGIAGLTAAYSLYQKEPTLDVLILEGSERIGGRILSVPLLVKHNRTVSYFDVGAQWVCKEQHRLFELLNNLGIQYQTPRKHGKIIMYYKQWKTYERYANCKLPFLSVRERFQFSKFIIKVEILCRKIKSHERKEERPTYIQELSQISLEDFIKKTVSSEAVISVIEHMVFSHCGDYFTTEDYLEHSHTLLQAVNNEIWQPAIQSGQARA